MGRGCVVTLLGLLLTAGTAHAIDPAVKCGTKKIKEAVKYARCLGKAEAKAIRKAQPPVPVKCDTKFSAKWQKIEAKAEGACPSTMDEEVIRAQVEQFVQGLVMDLEPLPPLPPLPPCPTGAAGFGGACWYLGSSGEGCDTVCANVTLVYDFATETVAGSGGSLAQCEAVLNALGISGIPSQLSCPVGLGCHIDGLGAALWCDSPTTDLSSASSSAERVCACQ